MNPRNLQSTEDRHNNFYPYTNSFVSQPSCVNALNTASSILQYNSYAPQYGNYDTNGVNGQVLNQNLHSVNSSNMLHSSQPQINQCGVYKFEIPGFEIIVRPTSNSMINLNNLGAQSHSSQLNQNQNYIPRVVDPVAVMPSQLNQNQNYIPRVVENSANDSYANSVNNMNMQNMQNIYNDQHFFTQSQFQQQN